MCYTRSYDHSYACRTHLTSFWYLMRLDTDCLSFGVRPYFSACHFLSVLVYSFVCVLTFFLFRALSLYFSFPVFVSLIVLLGSSSYLCLEWGMNIDRKITPEPKHHCLTRMCTCKRTAGTRACHVLPCILKCFFSVHQFCCQCVNYCWHSDMEHDFR